MKRALLAFLLVPAAAWAFGTDPFGASVESRPDSEAPVLVKLSVPPRHILYADEVRITGLNAKLELVRKPASHRILDKFTGERKDVYDADVEFAFRVTGSVPETLELQVAYQGCDDSVCFFPQKKRLTLSLAGVGPAPAPEVPTIGKSEEKTSNDWKTQLDRYGEPRTAAGYLAAPDFLDFLGGSGDRTLADFERRGWVWTIVLLVIGGAALNLTPCVLPLIPVNLAILGAGARARSRRQGFLLGGAYGLAMALVYGLLGVLVVLTGAKFGALNASVGFNAAIAVLFVVLALAMFDVVTIDLSRFQSSRAGAAGTYAAAMGMGAISALLAGACVAPVLISTLLLAGHLYAQGNAFAAFMPLLLGVGMGLPWPFAGAGLSVLPKPGRWMSWVKYAFGVLIFGLAVYYGRTAWNIHAAQAPAGKSEGDPAIESVRRLEAALAAGRPVFIDFWATWCKNCHAMEATTFRDERVRARLADFEVVKFQAEFPDRSPAREVLDHFGAVGLPTYVVLLPR